ncbi:MAG: hypothetical protein QOE93_2413, partial [Actinomycetota bacterium]|nr:hypothetical protein [Actinomycetota bacterium]
DDETLILVNPVVFPQGPTDVNSDGRQDAFIVVGADPSTAYLGIYVLVGCDLMRVLDSGLPAVFSSGATVTHLDGVQCVDHTGDGVTDILQYRGTSTDGITYTIQTSVVTVSPTGGIIPSLSPPQFTTTSPGMYSGFDCGDLHGVQLTG